MFSQPAVGEGAWALRLVRFMDFEELANKHKDAVYRQMLRACGNREDAEDVLIEALSRAYRHLHQLDGAESFRAWLASIGRRVCWRLKRREAVMPLIQLSEMEDQGIEIPSSTAASDAQWDAIEMKELLERALRSLPEDCRRVYELRDLDNEPGEKVAEALGISVAAMKSRLHRARALLRERLDTVLRGNYESVEGVKRWKSQ
jgi:RNA polymerase sigma-70 factor (ECF subfamily)